MRLIDADAISEDILSLTMTITGLWGGKGVLNEFMQEYRRSVLRIVDDAATVDAVLVVRCRDCKFGDWDSEPNDAMVCMRTKDGFWRSGNDFCSYGERKEGAD